jgi:hypothetical protein
MYKKINWKTAEMSLLEPSLRTAVEESSEPKPKKERYLDEETGKYKFREKKIEKVKCFECKSLFYANRPKQIFCQDFCRMRNWQKIHRKELKIEKRIRIKKMWG